MLMFKIIVNILHLIFNINYDTIIEFKIIYIYIYIYILYNISNLRYLFYPLIHLSN